MTILEGSPNKQTDLGCKYSPPRVVSLQVASLFLYWFSVLPVTGVKLFLTSVGTISFVVYLCIVRICGSSLRFLCYEFICVKGHSSVLTDVW